MPHSQSLESRTGKQTRSAAGTKEIPMADSLAYKGSLEPGKLADLAVLSQDIFSVPTAELPKTQTVLTLVGGKTVYDAGVLH